ncbi:MAG: Uma2 family endonuclease [Cyanobacteriota bacterium]
MLLELEQIIVPPGHQLALKNVSWQQFQEILGNLGESRSARLSYSQGRLEIMTPLPEHEDDKVIIGDLVKAILEEMDIEFRSLGSTTFENAAMKQAVEPDDCFYIQNEAKIRGKKRINLEIDPPPELAIEIDITSRTRFNNYQDLGVTELWRYNGENLEINVLQSGQYVQSEKSLIFSSLPIAEVLHDFVEQSKVRGRNATMKAFRAWVREQLARQEQHKSLT